MRSRWIQEATSRSRRGALHRQLGIPKDRKIPTKLLNSIKRAEIGATVKAGGKRVKVTRLIKQRAVFAANVRKKR